MLNFAKFAKCKRKFRIFSGIPRQNQSFVYKWFEKKTFKSDLKGIEFVQKNQNLESLYLCNLIVYIFDFSNLDYLILQNL